MLPGNIELLLKRLAQGVTASSCRASLTCMVRLGDVPLLDWPKPPVVCCCPSPLGRGRPLPPGRQAWLRLRQRCMKEIPDSFEA